MAIGGNQPFTSEFARTVGRDWDTGAVLLPEGNTWIFTIYVAPGSVQNLADLVCPHRFENILREIGSFPEINVRLGDSFRDIGIRGQMEDRIATGHRGCDRAEILEVGLNYLYPAIIGRLPKQRHRTRTEVIENHNPLDVGTGHQKPDKVAPNKAGP